MYMRRPRVKDTAAVFLNAAKPRKTPNSMCILSDFIGENDRRKESGKDLLPSSL